MTKSQIICQSDRLSALAEQIELCLSKARRQVNQLIPCLLDWTVSALGAIVLALSFVPQPTGAAAVQLVEHFLIVDE